MPTPPKPPLERDAKLARPEKTRAQSERLPWAELLRRVFGRDGWACPSCGERLELRCVVLGPASGRVVRGLLRETGPPGRRDAGDDREA